MNIDDSIKKISEEFSSDLNNIKNQNQIDDVYLKYFSKKSGLTTHLLKSIKDLNENDKKKYGPQINELAINQKNYIENKKLELINNAHSDPLMDLSIPREPKRPAMLHPTTQLFSELNEFFRYLGFSVVEGPHIETREFNFGKLNVPIGHPATDLQDSLYIHQGAQESDSDILLRTHTSSVETRLLSSNKPPIRAVAPGAVYRNETLTATNSSFFTQYQGFVVDKGITMQHLKTTLEQLHKYLFGDDVKLRFRYKYYPEVSPGLGVDMQCKFCSGEGCEVCKYRGYIEMLGSGMIHYNMLKMCGIDPEIYSGYAFGLGSDRFVMQRFGISDIRKLYGGGIYYK